MTFSVYNYNQIGYPTAPRPLNLESINTDKASSINHDPKMFRSKYLKLMFLEGVVSEIVVISIVVLPAAAIAYSSSLSANLN